MLLLLRRDSLTVDGESSVEEGSDSLGNRAVVLRQHILKQNAEQRPQHDKVAHQHKDNRQC
jgi:hypothetical protein